jgi:hypothetical protein
MQVKKNLIVLSVFSCVLFSKANAQQTTVSESATAIVSATIVSPIAITKTTDMQFGNVSIKSGVAGTVILAPDGTRTATGGASVSTNMAGSPAAALFHVTGAPGYHYSIILPASISLTRTGGSEVMSVGTFMSTPEASSILTSGAEDVSVGATLNISGSQVAGTYTNSSDFTVTVAYN